PFRRFGRRRLRLDLGHEPLLTSWDRASRAAGALSLDASARDQRGLGRSVQNLAAARHCGLSSACRQRHKALTPATARGTAVLAVPAYSNHKALTATTTRGASAFRESPVGGNGGTTSPHDWGGPRGGHPPGRE